MRAGSKFTFRPDEPSEDRDDQFSQDQDYDQDAGEEEEENDDFSNDMEPTTAQHFFSLEFKEVIRTKEYAEEAKTRQLKQIARRRWSELTLKQKAPFEQLASMEAAKRKE